MHFVTLKIVSLLYINWVITSRYHSVFILRGTVEIFYYISSSKKLKALCETRNEVGIKILLMASLSRLQSVNSNNLVKVGTATVA